jgi:hypothetical protein
MGTSGISVVVVSVDADGDVETVCGVEVVEVSDDVVAAVADVVVAYTVVKIFESANEMTLCATTEANGIIRPIILVVVPVTDESLVDASDADGTSLIIVSVAGVVSVDAVQSLVEAFAISNAAARKAFTDASLDDESGGACSIVLEVDDADDVVEVSSVAGGSMTGSGSVTGGGVIVVLEDVLSSIEEELVSVVGGTVVGREVGESGVTVSFSDAGAIADAASCMDVEFCGVNAPAGARYERSCVSALTG